jgi:hypothetical protein
MSELKPCPFCGSKPEQYDNEYACCTGSKCPMANMVIDNRVWNTRAVLAQEAGKCEPVAWANGEQLKLCAASPREVQPNNPMLHNLPRNIAGSALPTEYCNTPLFAAPPAPVSVVLPAPKVPDDDGFDPDQYSYGWNACLDKVKELNQ